MYTRHYSRECFTKKFNDLKTKLDNETSKNMKTFYLPEKERKVQQQQIKEKMKTLNCEREGVLYECRKTIIKQYKNISACTLEVDGAEAQSKKAEKDGCTGHNSSSSCLTNLWLALIPLIKWLIS